MYFELSGTAALVFTKTILRQLLQLTNRFIYSFLCYHNITANWNSSPLAAETYNFNIRLGESERDASLKYTLSTLFYFVYMKYATPPLITFLLATDLLYASLKILESYVTQVLHQIKHKLTFIGIASQ